MESFAKVAQSIEQYVIKMRRKLHAHPETRWETAWTREFIAGELRKMGLRPFTRLMQSGIFVDVDFLGVTERILFRADFDALPVPEKTRLPFASKVGGKSHACGHDVGTAMLLGFLKAITQKKIQLTHNLRIFFQDAEENPGTNPRPESGAEVAVQEGVCDGISNAYALHIDNLHDASLGIFRSRAEAMLGNSGRINFKVKSSGGHVAEPHAGVNALRVCNAIMNHLSGFIARHFNPVQPATLEPAVLNAGTGSNIMPAEAEMWWGFRTMLSRPSHEAMAALIEREIHQIAAACYAEITEVKLIHGHPALICDRQVVEKTNALLAAAGEQVAEINPLLGGEDFAHIAMRVPSALYMLGARGPNSGGDHHTPTFNPDESVFWRGVHFWLLLATS